jgi:hypothetical protein
MESSTIHTCHNQHLNEEMPEHCRCRKRIALAEAAEMVASGFAQWLIISQVILTGKEICPVCLDDDFRKNCLNCKRTGEVEKSYPVNTYSNDIVLVAVGTEHDGKIIYKSVLAKQTPRVATIEKAHIERAYVQNDAAEQARIEAYGLMTLKARIEMGINPEPDDNPEEWDGRNFDRGRSPYARISDERTNSRSVGSRISEGFKTMDPYEHDKDYE